MSRCAALQAETCSARSAVQPLLLPRSRRACDHFKIRPNASRQAFLHNATPLDLGIALRHDVSPLPPVALLQSSRPSRWEQRTFDRVSGTDQPPAGTVDRRSDVCCASTSRSPPCFAATHSGRPCPLSAIQRPACPQRWHRARCRQIRPPCLEFALATASFSTLCCIFVLIGYIWPLVSEMRFYRSFIAT